MAELQHPESRSFELVAEVYERARPEYPPDAIAWLAEKLELRKGLTVLDLAAGTGKLTRAVLATGARVIAVEPGEAMLAELVRAIPTAEALRGAAENIPLPDASVDAVTVGQGFHWFRHDEAIPELHRVLRSGGGLALLWNSRDPHSPLQREITELLTPFLPRGGRAASHDSTRYLSESDLFGPLEERSFPFIQELDADGLVDRLRSTSYVAAAADDRRAELERKLREFVVARGGVIEFPYLTDVYVSYAV